MDKPGAAQSEIRIGRIGAARSTPDYDALEVMNTALGGSFTSRLNQNLREDKGYTYGAGSGFGFRLLPGPFLASSAVQTDATAAALQEFFKEFDGIREPMSDEELTRAKNYVALSFPSGFQSVQFREIEILLGLQEHERIPYVGAGTYQDVLRESAGSEGWAIRRVKARLAFHLQNLRPRTV